MRELLSDNDFMTWALVLAVYFMLCGMGWRSTSANKPPRRSNNQEWSIPVLLVTPFLFMMCLPSMLSVALLRTALDKIRRR